MANGDKSTPFSEDFLNSDFKEEPKSGVTARQPQAATGRPTPGFRPRLLSSLLGIAGGVQAAAGQTDPLQAIAAGFTGAIQAPSAEDLELQKQQQEIQSELQGMQLRQAQRASLPATDVLSPEAVQSFKDAGIDVSGSIGEFMAAAKQNLELQNVSQQLDEFRTSARKSLPLSADQAKFFASMTGRPEKEFLNRTLDEVQTGFKLAGEARKGTASQVLTKSQKLAAESRLRQEFSTASKRDLIIRDSIQNVRVSAKEANGPGDVAMIFNFMKILDPGSVVRQSEFDTAARAAGIPERIFAAIASGKTGATFDPKTRAKFLITSNNLFNSKKGNFKLRQEEFKRVAIASGLDFENIILRIRGFEDEEKTPEDQSGRADRAKRRATLEAEKEALENR